MIKNRICWNENFKLRLASCDDSMMFHDVIKLMVVKKILKKNEKYRNFLRIYTEFDIMDSTMCDIYVENLKTKECFAYEIQKSVTKKWKENTLRKYKGWEVYGFKSSNLVIVPIKDCPNTIQEINKWLDDFIY